MTVGEFLFGYKYDRSSDPRKIIDSKKDLDRELVVKVDGEYFVYDGNTGCIKVAEGKQKDIFDRDIVSWSIQANISADSNFIECCPVIWTEESETGI